jgi:mono/diheme cytochrome c family protein
MTVQTMFRLAKVILCVGFVGGLLLLGVRASAQETGESLFKGKCAMCHGADGAGKTVMGEKLKIPDLHSTDVQKKTDADLKGMIAKGKDKMPAYEGKLSKEQIDLLVGFIRDLEKKK